MEPTTNGRSTSLPTLKTIGACAVYCALAVVFIVFWRKYLAVSGADGEAPQVLKFQNVVVDLGCFIFIIIASDISNYSRDKDLLYSNPAGWAKTAFFITLTTFPALAQLSLDNTDGGHSPNLFECLLAFRENQLPHSVDYYYALTVKGMLGSSVLLSLILAYSLNRHTSKLIEGKRQENITYSIGLSWVSGWFAVVLLSVYLIFSHSTETQLECSYIRKNYEYISVTVFSTMLVFVAIVLVLTRLYSSIVLLPAINQNRPARNWLNGSLCVSVILFSFTVLYLFTIGIQRQHAFLDWETFLRLFAAAIYEAIMLAAAFITEGLPAITTVVYSVLRELLQLFYRLFALNNLITIAFLVVLTIPIISYLLLRAVRFLLLVLKYYPHISLFLLVVAASAVGGYLTAYTLKERNHQPLMEIKLNAEQRESIEKRLTE